MDAKARQNRLKEINLLMVSLRWHANYLNNMKIICLIIYYNVNITVLAVLMYILLSTIILAYITVHKSILVRYSPLRSCS